MYLKRRIIIDTYGNPVKFAMVMYQDKKQAIDDLDNSIFDSPGLVVGYLTSYEKAERCENYFNEAVENIIREFNF